MWLLFVFVRQNFPSRDHELVHLERLEDECKQDSVSTQPRVLQSPAESQGGSQKILLQLLKDHAQISAGLFTLYMFSMERNYEEASGIYLHSDLAVWRKHP